jgi:hypothetical protein
VTSARPSPLRQAVRAGKQEVAATLSRPGAQQDATDIDRFLGACVRGDRAEAKRLLDAQPRLPNRFSDEDRAASKPPEGGAEADGIDPAVVHEIAEQLTTAYRSLDMDLLGSLLHPNVHWGHGAAGCTDSDQVLRWYRRILAEGTHPSVEGVEVHGDTIALTVTLTRPAKGARPAPPQTIRQPFRICRRDDRRDPRPAGLRRPPRNEYVAPLRPPQGVPLLRNAEDKRSPARMLLSSALDDSGPRSRDRG